MADSKWSNLPSGSPAQTTDVVAIARSGANYQITLAQIVALFAAAIGFGSLTSGTNTGQALTVGNGSSLGPSGTGVVNANELLGVVISGTPSAGQVLTATSPTAAQWAAGSFTASFANPGYIIFTNLGGLTIQWGSTAVPVTGTTFSFPIAFATACLVGVASDSSASGSGGFQLVSASQFILNVSHNSTYNWIAIGY